VNRGLAGSLLSVLCFSRVLHAEPVAQRSEPLNSELLASRAVTTSSLLKLRSVEVSAAEAQGRRVATGFLPKLGLRASYTRLSKARSTLGEGAFAVAGNEGPLVVAPCPVGAADCVTDSQGNPVAAMPVVIDSVNDNYSLSATLQVPLSDYVLRLTQSMTGSDENTEAARISKRAEVSKIQTDAKVLYFEWLRARNRLSLAQQALVQVRARVQDGKMAFAAGALTQTELLELNQREALSLQMELEATSRLELAELDVALAMGANEPGSYTPTEEAVAPPKQAAELSALTERALQTRLELKAVEAQLRSVRAQSSSVKAGWWPRLDAYGEATYANPNPRYFPPTAAWNGSWAVGAALSMNVDEIFTTAATNSQLTANAELLQARKQTLEQAIRREVAEQYWAARRAEGAMIAADQGVTTATETHRVATLMHTEGRSTASDLVDTETALLAARLGELDARVDSLIANLRLRHAAGADVAER
jgi:outer membrane protein